MNFRLAAVAGSFYPADPIRLREMVQGYLETNTEPVESVTELVESATEPVEVPVSTPKAIIAPHAGYVYSGAIAGSAYVRVAALAGQVNG